MEEEKIFYKQSAENFQEALPIGNGFLGAMVYGGVEEDILSLNDDSLFAGKPLSRINSDARDTLPKVRALLKEGELYEAQRLAQNGMLACPRYMHAYQPLASFHIRTGLGSIIDEYERGLNLRDGIVYTRYIQDGLCFTRTYFASAPRRAIFVLLEADTPGALYFSVNMMRRPFDPGTQAINGNTLVMQGNTGDGGMGYCCMASLKTLDGTAEMLGDTISVSEATRALIAITSTTTFRSSYPFIDCKTVLEEALKYESSDLLSAHIQDYRSLYSRVSLSLDTNDMSHVPTDERVARYKDDKTDAGLYTLYFNYSRYLIICAGRQGSEAMNLQGIWNESYTPPWESAYTININIQMIYWPLQTLNLSELAEPLHRKIKQMQEHGRIVAREMYGCRGFVAHHNTSYWGDCAPSGAGIYLWTFGAAWLCLHLHEHYLHTLDKDFLKNTAYPLIKDSVLFFLDFLVKDEEGYLVTGLTQSPENAYVNPDGQKSTLSVTSTMDDAILRALFQAYLEEKTVLSLDDAFSDEVRRALSQLRPYRIGSKGQLLEWDKEYEECEPGHRHISHLFGLHPGWDIKPGSKLAEACAKTISIRLAEGGGHTGWSRAWIINFFARLHDARGALEHLNALLSTSTYPNLMDAHPPFQMDGNSGSIAGLLEMLMQSHDGEIYLLPAIDENFPDGSIYGLRARGGDLVDIIWKNGRVVKFSITAKSDEKRKVYYRDKDGQMTELNLVCTKGVATGGIKG